MSAPRRANRKAFRSVICLVLVLLGASLPLPALADDRWRIQGRLLDEKGAPVANAPVVAFCTGALPEGPFIDCGFPGLMGRQTRTGADGGFSLERLPPAIYSLYSALEAPGQGVTAEASLAIQLRQTQEGLELRLKRRVPAPREDEPRKSEEGWELQALSGQVVDSTGAPIRHVRVRAELDGPPERSREKYGSGYAISEDFGRFKIQGLREGTYRLEVSAEGFLTQKTVVRTSDEPRTFQLKRGGLVRGRAVKPDGSAVEKLNSDCREGYRSRLPEGRFEVFTYDESGAMRLCLSAPGMARVQRQLTLPPEQVLELGDVRMEPARPMKVRVTDLRTGAPVPWAKVTVVGAEPSARPLLTLDDGGARIEELPDMALDLDVAASGYKDARVHVRKGQTEVPVALDPGLVLAGRALTAEGQPDIGTVSAHCGEGVHTSGQVDPEGRFRLTGLREGLCTVSFQLISSPLPTFEYTRRLWLDGHQPPALEFRAPPKARHSVHLRFQGTGKPRRALLFAEELPQQTDLRTLLLQVGPVAASWMPETNGWRVGRREENGFRFERLGAGHYTLVVELPEGVFRVPLTMGEEEQTVTVEIPSELLPLPQ